MNDTKHKLDVVQNEGMVDRVFRFVIGAIILAIGVGGLTVTPHLTWWEASLIIVSVYPILTAILGWDPFYSVFGARSCRIDPSSKNACGSSAGLFYRTPKISSAALFHRLQEYVLARAGHTDPMRL